MRYQKALILRDGVSWLTFAKKCDWWSIPSTPLGACAHTYVLQYIAWLGRTGVGSTNPVVAPFV